MRGRIDIKYALSLELTDPGFDASVLREFRARLITGHAEEQLLTAMLTLFKERGKQRTDSTHVQDIHPSHQSIGLRRRNASPCAQLPGNGGTGAAA